MKKIFTACLFLVLTSSAFARLNYNWCQTIAIKDGKICYDSTYQILRDPEAKCAVEAQWYSSEEGKPFIAERGCFEGASEVRSILWPDYWGAEAIEEHLFKDGQKVF